ncbi:MAG: tyrosine-type recombinase/integrase, partial [Exiguobacterium acetylicum]
MASLSTRQDGSREVYIVLDGHRRKIQLGKLPKKDCASIISKIEQLAAKKLSGGSPDNEVATWLGSLANEEPLLKRLIVLGLATPRPIAAEPKPAEVLTLGFILDRFVEFKKPMVAERSLDKMNECLKVLADFLGRERDIKGLTVGSASEFESFGRKRGFSEAHQRTHNRYAKQLFAFAVDHEWISTNPFRKLKSSSLAATSRHYVTPEDTLKLLEACSPPEETEKPIGERIGIQWKLLIGLARYAGLRVPSEAFAITWAMVDWDKKALYIPSKKTRRYAESRPMPIIPELMAILEKGFEEAPEGADKILTLSVSNIRRKLPKLIQEAGLKPWEDMFQTLRRSCETHLVAMGHPTHAVSTWLGHSNQVSKDHYLMVTSDVFGKATSTKADIEDRPIKPIPKSGADSGAASSGIDRKGSESGALRKKSGALETDPLNEKTLDKPGFSSVVRAGLEPATHGFSVR